MRQIKKETLLRALESGSVQDRIVALELAECREDIPLEMIMEIYGNPQRDLTEKIMACGVLETRSDVPKEFIEQLLESDDYMERRAGARMMRCQKNATDRLVRIYRTDPRSEVRLAALTSLAGQEVKKSFLMEIVHSDEIRNSMAIAAAVAIMSRKKMLAPEQLQGFMLSNNWSIRLAAVEALNNFPWPCWNLVRRGVLDDDEDIFRATLSYLKSANPQKLPPELYSELFDFRKEERTQPVFKLEVLKFFQSRADVPREEVELLCHDDDEDVCMAAEALLSLEGPYVRQFEPEGEVFSLCQNGVIAVAKIPKDANIIGWSGVPSRASKAEIVDIIGDFFGEKVGVLERGLKVCAAGDSIEVEDFDLSSEKFAPGFYFYASLNTLREEEGLD